MVYITPDIPMFYLLRRALIQLGVISRDYPTVGAVLGSCPLEDDRAGCRCLKSELQQSRLAKLPIQRNVRLHWNRLNGDLRHLLDKEKEVRDFLKDLRDKNVTLLV